MLNPQADLFLSGILDVDLEAITTCLHQNELHMVSKKQRKNWMALHVK